jgi:para-aminobenzoate synthetase component 1
MPIADRPVERIGSQPPRALAVPRSLEAAVSALAADTESAWLDSSSNASIGSAVAFDPVGVLTFSPESGAVFESPRGLRRSADPWTLWREITRELPAIESEPFGPGWIGYVGYDMARTLERNRVPPAGRSPLPWLRMALYDRVIVLSPGMNTARLTCSPALSEEFGRDAADLDAYLERWNAAASLDAAAIHHARHATIIEQTPRAAHRKAVLRAKEYIAAGDIYQVNLAQQFKLGPIGDSASAYLRIRRSNPSPRGAFLRWDSGAVASVSPECFLSLARRTVTTRPIKGTRPRIGDAVCDAAARADLVASEKDAAELAMIVDLHRNDLGRVCEWGSVHVRCARRIEEHPTVFHTVADIDGTLAAERDAFDLLAACFPAGSVTGVPKIRAMEIIAELEQSPRGVYTGAIGWLGLSGDLSMNVAIRILQIHDEIGTLHVGGGIVADSDPDAEYEETLAKSRGILRALGVTV